MLFTLKLNVLCLFICLLYYYIKGLKEIGAYADAEKAKEAKQFELARGR